MGENYSYRRDTSV